MPTIPRRRAVVLTLVTLILASACKKNPVEPEGETSAAVAPDGPAVQAMLGHEAPVCRVGESVVWKGLRHAPAGTASLVASGDARPLLVTDLGPRGGDGFCTSFADAPVDQHSVVTQAWSFAGGAGRCGLTYRSQWVLASGAPVIRGYVYNALSYASCRGALVIAVVASDLGCEPAVIEFLRDGALVASGPVTCAASGQYAGAYVVAAGCGPFTESSVSAASMAWGIGDDANPCKVRANLPGQPVLDVDAIRFHNPPGAQATLRSSVLTVAGPRRGGGAVAVTGLTIE